VMVFTENATYMLLKDSSSPSGYGMRTVNSQIGVPKSDGDSVQAILNGILFKSGTKAYVYVPGRYSTVDTMLNIRRISDPIEGLLAEGVDVLSYVDDDEWHVFQRSESAEFPGDELVYNYAKGVWTRNVHRFFPTDAFTNGTSWRLLRSGDSAIVSYGKDIYDIPSVPKCFADLTYGDYEGPLLTNLALYADVDEDGVVDDDPTQLASHDEFVRPIPFALDTGQKSSRYTVDKQFLEEKFNFMSLDDKDAFPLSIGMYADGMPHRHRVDANTDSPLWRDSKTMDGGALATTFGDDDTRNSGIMRQMFVKYSGRGKTLRITIEGESQSRFAVYSAESRYRVLPNKQ